MIVLPLCLCVVKAATVGCECEGREAVSRRLLRVLVIASWVFSVLVWVFFSLSENQDLMSWLKSGLAKHIVRCSAGIDRQFLDPYP